MTRQTTRRTVLKGIGAGAATLSFAGQVSGGGDARYIAVGTGGGTAGHIESAGFSVQHKLADDTVFVVTGEADRQEDLEDVTGVSHASVDAFVQLDDPALSDTSAQTPDDAASEPFFGLQWDKEVTDVPAAHDTATGAGSTVAIIDTGIDADHPDLGENVDAAASRLFKLGTVTQEAVDPHGHGTHVAGIAAAPDNGVGVLGTAPDADLVSLRVFYFLDVDGDGEEELTTTTADIFLAIDHAADVGADAANMSLGTPPMPPQLNTGGIRAAEQRVVEDAVRRGTVVVTSAGNADADLQHGGTFVLPASVPGSMTVSATGPNDLRTFYSNFGTNVIDVGAPGGGFETEQKTFSEDTAFPFPENLVFSTMSPDSVLGQGAEYAFLAGTSMAAPQVAGTAALVREVAPDANAKTVESAIKDGAEGASGNSSPDLGAGRLNADLALDSSQL